MFRTIINSSSCRSKQFKLILNNRQQLKKSSIRPKSNLNKSVTNFSPILRQNSKICTTNFREDENKQRIEEIDAENVCKLDDGTPIFNVDDKTAFNDLIEFITNCTKNNEEIIGIDSEWGPYFVAKSEERMSILQIATSDAVYIVDIQRLNEENVIAEEEWLNLFKILFCNETMKIGYDFKNDLRMLEKTFPCTLKIFKKSKNILCLFRLFQQISHIPNASEIIFGPNPPEKLGLSCVAKHFLNIQLKKKIRMSNWHSRPLRIEQKKYAAMDAHILIKLYHRIQLDFKRLNADQQLSLQKNAFVKMVGRKNPIGKNKKRKTIF